jgi:hypothetical protein
MARVERDTSPETTDDLEGDEEDITEEDMDVEET